MVDGEKGDQTVQDTSMLNVTSLASLKVSGRFLAGNLEAPQSTKLQVSAEGAAYEEGASRLGAHVWVSEGAEVPTQVSQ